MPDSTLPKLLSVQVGLPQTILASDPDSKPWFSGFYKSEVRGWVAATDTRLAGDGQADLVNHGGVDKAILVYSSDHFPDWTTELNVSEIQGGMFGENLTVTGQDETTVCIGDRFWVNDVLLEVSQPRQPCWKLGRRFGISTLPKQVIQSGRCGWYCRVIQTGQLQSGLVIQPESRNNPDWTVRRAHQTMYDKDKTLPSRRELARLPELSAA